MEQLSRVARVPRYQRIFRGHIHIKIIPGAGVAAIEKAVSLATAVPPRRRSLLIAPLFR